MRILWEDLRLWAETSVDLIDDLEWRKGSACFSILTTRLHLLGSEKPSQIEDPIEGQKLEEPKSHSRVSSNDSTLTASSSTGSAK